MKDEETKQPEAQEPEVKETGEAPPEKVQPLAGFVIQLEEDGQITRKIYGTQQNEPTFYGLIEVMRSEVDAISSGMPGLTPTRETRLLSNVVTSLTNMANVLMGLQSGMNHIVAFLEESSDDKPEQEQQDSAGEEVSPEGS